MEPGTANIKIGKLSCDCASAGGGRTVYVITPAAPDEGLAARMAARHRVNVAVVHGLDWDDDTTPWPAPGVLREDADFRGGAAEFLDLLRDGVVAETERLPGMGAPEGRTLVGVSLSGLFALWAWMRDDVFSDIGCISASFWYDGFADWFCEKGVRPKSGSACLSLGLSEGGPGDHPRFRTVREDTERIVGALVRSGIRTEYFRTAGNHYAPFPPRLDKILASLGALSRG